MSNLPQVQRPKVRWKVQALLQMRLRKLQLGVQLLEMRVTILHGRMHLPEMPESTFEIV